jgi:hypothetical protein
MVKKYFVENRITKESAQVEAESAHEACTKMGWMPGDCYVREIPAKKGATR